MQFARRCSAAATAAHPKHSKVHQQPLCLPLSSPSPSVPVAAHPRPGQGVLPACRGHRRRPGGQQRLLLLHDPRLAGPSPLGLLQFWLGWGCTELLASSASSSGGNSTAGRPPRPCSRACARPAGSEQSAAALHPPAHRPQVHLYLDCPRQLGIACPSAQEVAAFRAAVDVGAITWHALPHNGEVGLCVLAWFAGGVGSASRCPSVKEVAAI